MPDPLYGMGRRLSSLEKAARPLNEATLPPALVVLVFEDDPTEVAHAYVDELGAEAWMADTETNVVVVQLLSKRSATLLPAWAPGRRQWLDYQPDPYEQRHLRSDLDRHGAFDAAWRSSLSPAEPTVTTDQKKETEPLEALDEAPACSVAFDLTSPPALVAQLEPVEDVKPAGALQGVDAATPDPKPLSITPCQRSVELSLPFNGPLGGASPPVAGS